MPAGDLRELILKHISRKWHNTCLNNQYNVDALKFIPFQGTSMLPGLKKGDILVVLPTPGIHPVQGEIVLKRREDKTFIAHRVIGFNEKKKTVRTRGDSRLFSDKIWHLRQNFGRVIAVWRRNSILCVPEGPSFLKRCLASAHLLLPGVIRRLKSGVFLLKHHKPPSLSSLGGED